MAAEFAQPRSYGGYGSLMRALTDLIRFGPGAFGATKFLVFLFHLERCHTWGATKTADAHAISQALHGVFDRQAGKWVRGTSGVGKTAYTQYTRQLVADKILAQARVTNQRGDADASVYQINWGAVRALLQKTANDLVGTYSPLFADPTPEEDHPDNTDEMDNPDNDRVVRVANNRCSPGEQPVVRVANSRCSRAEQPVVHVANTQEWTLQSVDPHNPDRHESSGGEDLPQMDIPAVRDMLNRTLAAAVIADTDPLPAQLAYLARRMHGPCLTTSVLRWWIADHVAAKRKRGKSIEGPGYWQHLVGEGLPDLRSWLVSNRQEIQRLLIHEIEQDRASRLAEMPAPRFTPVHPLPEKVRCSTCLAVEAIPHGDMLVCVSPRCDPNGVLWPYLLRHYATPNPPRKAAKRRATAT